MAEMQDYELRAFFTHVVGVLERLEIPYMVVGGFATILYGEPRLTLDVDIVVDMKTEHVLIAHDATQSEKHLRDARGVLVIQGDDLDLGLIRRGAQQAGVAEILEFVLRTAQRDVQDMPGADIAE
jgi:hypothetical protein